MTTDAQKRSLMSLILIAAVITFAITLLRLFGELQHWSPKFFSRQAGGAGAIVGIVWLVPIFGIYFAIRLNQAGHGPRSRGRAIGLALAALAVGIAVSFTIFKLSLPIVATIVLANLACFLSLW